MEKSDRLKALREIRAHFGARGQWPTAWLHAIEDGIVELAKDEQVTVTMARAEWENCVILMLTLAASSMCDPQLGETLRSYVARFQRQLEAED